MSRNVSAAVLATTLIILHSKTKKPIKKRLVLRNQSLLMLGRGAEDIFMDSENFS